MKRGEKGLENWLLAMAVGFGFLIALWALNFRRLGMPLFVYYSLTGLVISLAYRAHLRSERLQFDLTCLQHGMKRGHLLEIGSTGTRGRHFQIRVKDQNVITVRPATWLDHIAAYWRMLASTVRRRVREIGER